ncbi:MAG: glycerol acyltransferase [Comamonadaceae bacterium]|nr:MAG: glycerol acyltransferase [Comamonadaceae bacterium]
MHPTISPTLDTLTEINIDDLLDAMGLLRMRNTPVRRLLRPTARRFALIADEFDARVGRHGLTPGSAWLMGRMTAGIRNSGLGHVPAQGPVIIVSNHPGMTDTVALFASLTSRPDLRVLALDRPFLRALPNVARQLIFLSDDPAGQMAAVRAAARHLKEGGALLTFPAGAIEPDPATFGAERAQASLDRWSASYALLARLAPRAQLVPALVSHVISSAAQRHPLARMRRKPDDREKAAAALQVALPRYRDMVARVDFGAPTRAGDSPALDAAVAARMRQLIQATAGVH